MTLWLLLTQESHHSHIAILDKSDVLVSDLLLVLVCIWVHQSPPHLPLNLSTGSILLFLLSGNTCIWGRNKSLTGFLLFGWSGWFGRLDTDGDAVLQQPQSPGLLPTIAVDLHGTAGERWIISPSIKTVLGFNRASLSVPSSWWSPAASSSHPHPPESLRKKTCTLGPPQFN